MSLRSWSAAARFGLPGVLVGLALAGWTGGQRGVHAEGNLPGPPDRSRSVAPAAMGESNGTVAMIAPLTQGPAGSPSQLLYLVDTKSRAFAVYRIDPANAKGTIKLEGVRQYNWDMKLTEYKNQDPDVASTEAAVKSVGAPSR